MLDYWYAFLLAVVEGLTEFIPVSSTGHMLLLAEYLNLHSEQAKSFIIFIQLGAILAVAVVYRQRVTKLFSVFNPQRQELNWLHFVLAILPVMVAGALLYTVIRNHLFGALPVAVGLLVGGVIMIWVDKQPREWRVQDLDSLSYKDAFLVGVGQCFALWPGVSRSGATMVAALLRNINHQTAADFSFLLAIPVMLLAVSYDLFKSWGALSVQDFQLFGFGFLIAFLAAFASVRLFLGILPKVRLLPFGVYRILLGGLWLWWLS